jgi:hypothetical protein
MNTKKISGEKLNKMLDSLSSDPFIHIKGFEINIIDWESIDTFGKSFVFEDCIFITTVADRVILKDMTLIKRQIKRKRIMIVMEEKSV